MKITHKISILAVIIIALCANSCKEVGPQIDLTNGKHNELIDTSYVETTIPAAEPKAELIELFTGVSCINCPAAHLVLDNIRNANAGRVIGISMHSTQEPISQDAQLPDSRQPLGCEDAQTIISQFGDPGARPVGSVDRIVHNGTFGGPFIYDVSSNWSNYTTARLALPTPVNIILSGSYDASSKTAAITVELHYTSAQADSNKLTIFLTEDSIVTSQLQADNSNDPNYVHNDVLRAAVTNALGDRINTNLVAGTVVRKVFTYNITNSIWRPEHMHVVAVVHKYQNGAGEIIHAKMAPLL